MKTNDARPGGRSFPVNAEALKATLKGYGGDIAVIDRLEAFLPKSTSPLAWSPKSVAQLRKEALALKAAVAGCGLELKSAESLSAALLQFARETKIYDSPWGKQFFADHAPARKRGNQVEVRAHAWIGALLPYLAALDVKEEDSWKWLNAWIGLHFPDLSSLARKLWKQAVEDRVTEGRAVSSDLSKLLVGACELCLCSLRWSKAARRSKRFRSGPPAGLVTEVFSEPWSDEERDYLKAVGRLMPFLKERFERPQTCAELEVAQCWVSR